MSGQTQAILEGRRKARERWVSLPEMDLLLRRPKEYELAQMAEKTWSEVLAIAVVDWRRARARDFLAGAGEEEIAFDASLLMDWLEDNVERYAEVLKHLIELIKERDATAGK